MTWQSLFDRGMSEEAEKILDFLCVSAFEEAIQ